MYDVLVVVAAAVMVAGDPAVAAAVIWRMRLSQYQRIPYQYHAQSVRAEKPALLVELLRLALS